MNDGFHAPRKSLGQNFLQDPNIVRKIVGAVGATPNDVVLEIGPGRGALTELLIDSGCQLHLVEFDRDLVEYWQERAGGNRKLKVHGGDILNFDFKTLGLQPGQKLKIVGNLPYNISSPILIHLLDYTHLIERAIIMLQKEVIDRLVASPNNKTFGRLSVVIQQSFDVTALFNVPNTAFFPPPKVTSSVAQLLPHSRHTVSNQAVFSDLVKTAFSQRRKTLRNNVKKSPYQDTLENSSIDLGRRAETLSVAEFVAPANAVKT